MGDEKDGGKHEGKPHEYHKVKAEVGPDQGDGVAKGGGKREGDGK
ncbi:hypothetical protein [Nonomuraea candida]|nr:hypothetical protein [Nonomuraea candida]